MSDGGAEEGDGGREEADEEEAAGRSTGGAERLQERVGDANRSAHTTCLLVSCPIGSVIFMELSPSAIVLFGADRANRGTIWR